MTIEQIAEVCHEANRAYCATTGDTTSHVAWADAPAWQKESAIAGVRDIVNGLVWTPEQSHAAWTAERARAGWVFGPVKDAETRQHPNMVAYDQLSVTQQAKDAIFFAIVRALRPYTELGIL